MKYDVIIYIAENLREIFEPDSDVIRVNGLTEEDAKMLAKILIEHDRNICLLPYEE